MRQYVLYCPFVLYKPNVGCCVKHENVLENCKKFKSTIKFTINMKQLHTLEHDKLVIKGEVPMSKVATNTNLKLPLLLKPASRGW